MTVYIHHTTLTTGHTSRSERSEVSDAALALLSPWLDQAVAAGLPLPLPVPALSHFSAAALVADGALVVTLFVPAGPHVQGTPADGKLPMVTLGVAQRSRHAAKLWSALEQMPGAKRGMEPPGAPWCAAVLHPSAQAYSDDVSWLGDLERCIAWAWITRRPALQSVK